MKKTITIGCVLILAAASCGTAAVDGPDAGRVATSETSANETTASDATVETASVDDAADAVTATTAEPEATATTQAKVPGTTRAPSGATGTESSTTTSEGGNADGNVVEGGGDDTVIGQVPTLLMDQVFTHAEGHTGVAASAMTVLRAESVTWPDGSLGCPEPGTQYTQALVPGYWVEIAVAGDTFDYRLSEKGGMKLCEGEGLVPSPRDDT